MELFGISLLEIFGYMGSFVVLISLTMGSIIKLRWINLIGAAMFSVYSILIGSFPTFIMNFGIVLIDIYFLTKLYKVEA